MGGDGGPSDPSQPIAVAVSATGRHAWHNRKKRGNIARVKGQVSPAATIGSGGSGLSLLGAAPCILQDINGRPRLRLIK